MEGSLIARVLITSAILLVACGNDDDDTDTVAPTFTEVRDDILIPSCGFSTCHGGGEGGLTISEADPGAIYSALVDAPSFVLPTETLVIPGDSDNSYLIKKVEAATGIDGDPMPAPFGLDETLAGDIRAWIDAGAADD